MELLPSELRQALPTRRRLIQILSFTQGFSLRGQTGFGLPEGEPEGDDYRFFGYFRGQEDEWGYFLLSELQSARGPFGLTIERNLNFKPGRFHDAVEPPED